MESVQIKSLEPKGAYNVGNEEVKCPKCLNGKSFTFWTFAVHGYETDDVDTKGQNFTARENGNYGNLHSLMMVRCQKCEYASIPDSFNMTSSWLGSRRGSSPPMEGRWGNLHIGSGDYRYQIEPIPLSG